jgi:enoyl-CoA hydratase
MGLLSEVVPKGTALDRAREVSWRLAAKSSSIMKIGRDAFMRAIDAELRRSVENCRRELCSRRDHRRLSKD